jgi:DnaJ family protein B protein 13
MYDIYGYDGLRSGIRDREGNLKGGYKYAGDANEIFRKFFATTNPYALKKDPDRFDDEYGTMFSSAFGGQYSKPKDPLPNVVVDFECTLEELYNGCVKTLVYSRRVLNQDGRTTCEKEEHKEIEIFKGYDKSISLTFPGFGNDAPAQKSCT